MTLASDAPGSLFGKLEKITRNSEHHSYLAHELPLFYGVTVASFLAPCLDQGLATVSLFSVVLRFVVHFLVRPFTTPSRVHVSTEPQALKIIRSSVLHPLVEGLSRDDWLLARPLFMIAS